MTLETTAIPQPPGSKQHPYTRSVRLVDPKNNPTMIIGIPKLIAVNCDIEAGTEFKVWMERNPDSKKWRIVYEKTV